MQRGLSSLALLLVLFACERMQQQGRTTAAVAGSGGPIGGPSGSGGAAGTGGGAAVGGSGPGGSTGLGDPDVYRAVDDAAVCGPTPTQGCEASGMRWVASEYGSSVLRDDDLGATSVVYRLVAFVERVGPSNLDVLVVDELGQPLFDVPVAFYYASAPEPSRPDEWFPVKVSALTGANGIAGFALASSAYLPCCGCGGPHGVWVSEPGDIAGTTVPSDLAADLGMLGGTNHRHLDLIFQRVPPDFAPADASRCPLE
jgi:hypothetical protein